MSTTETTPTAPEVQQEQPKEATAVVKKEKYTPELCVSAINKLPAQLQALKNCFAQPFDSFRNAFKDPKEADRVMAKEIEFTSQAMMANSYLIKCATSNPISLVNALKNVALTRSTLNPVLKQGYLVPFGGAITFMPSYMGLVDVLVNNGLVRKVEAHPVFEGEEFEIKHGTGGGIFHKPNPWGKREKENLLGVYYYAVLIDGTEMFDTLSKEEIEKIRKRAPSAKSSSPWDTDYVEMAKKSAIRRAFKMIPKNGISEDKVKSLEAVFDYDEKVEQSWIAEQKAAPKRDTFDEDVEFEEVID
ncbi:MAG: RecT family recombinase [Muribaculaceae bacterium]|nr:RecT family recombinase [Muribaculaceae bacterium]